MYSAALRGERLLAYAPVYVQPVADGPEEQPHIAWAEIKTYPDLANPYPIKDLLLERLIERARTIVREAQLPARPLRLMFEYRLNEIPAVEYLLSRGFAYAKSTFQMVRDLPEPLPRTTLADGLRIRRWKMECKDEQQGYVDARNECFPQATISLESWLYFMQSAEWKNGAAIGCFAGDELVGNVSVYWNEEEIQAEGLRFGYTEDIFVRPGWRGQGIARAMLAEGMRFLQEKDMAQARLSVAAMNETALRLYQGLGYRVAQESQQYGKDF